MKRILSIAVITFFMMSCGAKTADDVNINDIKSACDCVDALDIIANDILDYVGDKSENDMEGDKDFESKYEKLDKVYSKCKSDYEREDAEKCDGYDKLEETMKKFEEKF